MSETPSAFPPQTIEAFLRLCAGEWMALRSGFDLGSGEGKSGDGESGDEWHSSERGELVVTYLEPEAGGDGPGGLGVGPKGQTPRQLHFDGQGRFEVGEWQGRWQLWPDGSLELTQEREGTTVRERIWFTKPNLRLRSCIAQGQGDAGGRASFSSEIRRVSQPSAAGAP